MPPSLADENHPDIEGQAIVIAFNFSLETVELQSLGFKDGERGDDQVRPGVQGALVRGIAVAVACSEDRVDLKVHPVGLDRTLVTVAISCLDEAELNIREDWLRTSLGIRESRARWAKGLEADLARVGVCGSEGEALALRFGKSSKPQRTTPEGAARIGLDAVRVASLGDAARKRAERNEKPTPVSLGRASIIDADEDPNSAFWDDGLMFAQTRNLAYTRGSKSERPRDSETRQGARHRNKKGKGKSRPQAASTPLGAM